MDLHLVSRPYNGDAQLQISLDTVIVQVGIVEESNPLAVHFVTLAAVNPACVDDKSSDHVVPTSKICVHDRTLYLTRIEDFLVEIADVNDESLIVNRAETLVYNLRVELLTKGFHVDHGVGQTVIVLGFQITDFDDVHLHLVVAALNLDIAQLLLQFIFVLLLFQPFFLDLFLCLRFLLFVLVLVLVLARLLVVNTVSTRKHFHYAGFPPYRAITWNVFVVLPVDQEFQFSPLRGVSSSLGVLQAVPLPLVLLVLYR